MQKNYPLFCIRNLGNTCYINSIIQCLRHCKDLDIYLSSNKFKKDLKERNSLLESFKNILDSTRNVVPKSVIRPISFIEKFDKQFHEIALIPQDAPEAIHFLLDRFHKAISKNVKITRTNTSSCSLESWKKFYQKDYSKIINIFFGQYEISVKCNECNNVSKSFVPFNDIQVELTDTLIKSLDIFLKEEDVEKKCEKCSINNNVLMKKKYCITMFPENLIIQIKRFKFIVERNKILKINGGIDVPELMDLSKYYAYKNMYGMYKLYGGIIHKGSAEAGHYTAFCKSNDFWWEYDDDSIRGLKPIHLKYLKKNAYVLFYKKI